MDAVRQDRVLAGVGLSGGDQRRVTPGARHVAFGIELDDRRRRLGLEWPAESTAVRVCSAHALRGSETARLEAAGDDDEVVLRVDAGPAGFAGYPVVRQRLRPERIDLERGRNQPFFRFRRAGDRLHADKANANGQAEADGSRKRIPFVRHDTPLLVVRACTGMRSMTTNGPA